MAVSVLRCLNPMGAWTQEGEGLGAMRRGVTHVTESVIAAMGAERGRDIVSGSEIGSILSFYVQAVLIYCQTHFTPCRCTLMEQSKMLGWSRSRVCDLES